MAPPAADHLPEHARAHLDRFLSINATSLQSLTLLGAEAPRRHGVGGDCHVVCRAELGPRGEGWGHC